MLLSVLILSCDPDEAKKKPSENNTTQDDQDNQDDNQTNKPKPIKATKLTRAKSTLPVSLDAVGIDSGNPKDANNTVWVFQDAEITFTTKAKDKNGNEIANARFKWEWRKRGKETTTKFGHTWTEITGQTTETATLTIPAKERVGAYELRVSATSGGKSVESAKLYKFTVRKKAGCLAPSTTNQPADRRALKALLGKMPPLTDAELQAIDTSQIYDFNALFHNRNFNKDVSCWDVSNATTMSYTFTGNPTFNQDISDWDTSQVTNMRGIFENASAFNQDLNGWDVSKVTDKDNFDDGTTAWKEANKLDFP